MTKKKSRCKSKIWTIIEAIIIVLFLGAYSFGYYYFLGYVDISVYENSQYMQSCFVGGDLPFVPGALYLEWIFDYLLRALFMLIGNHVMAAFWLQFAIIVIGIFVLYRGMRKTIHPLITIIAMAVVLCSSLFLFVLMPLNSGCIIFLLFSLFFYFISLFVHRRMQKKFESVKADMEINVTTESQVSEDNAVKEDKPIIKFLDNPLPGPKKHVSKTLDYDLKEADLVNVSMEYDIEVSEDDDFDV